MEIDQEMLAAEERQAGQPTSVAPAQPAQPAASETQEAPQLAEGTQRLLQKYGGDVNKLAEAYASMQAEYTRVKQQPPAKQGEEGPGPAEQALADIRRQQEVTQALHQVAGGQREYEGLKSFVMQSTDPLVQEAAARQRVALEAGDLAAARDATAAIKLKHLQQYGFSGGLLQGAAMGSNADEQPYANDAELEKAMADPRYDHTNRSTYDEAYVMEVERRSAGMLRR
jgi:hypothetical protein